MVPYLDAVRGAAGVLVPRTNPLFAERQEAQREEEEEEQAEEGGQRPVGTELALVVAGAPPVEQAGEQQRVGTELALVVREVPPLEKVGEQQRMGTELAPGVGDPEEDGADQAEEGGMDLDHWKKRVAEEEAARDEEDAAAEGGGWTEVQHKRGSGWRTAARELAGQAAGVPPLTPQE